MKFLNNRITGISILFITAFLYIVLTMTVKMPLSSIDSKMWEGYYTLVLEAEAPIVQIIADLAYLIRDDLKLNHHAFPTKFAEYLASGVPVITTPYIHTIAPMVKNNDLGEVIEPFKLGKNYDEIIDFIYKKYKNNYNLKNKYYNLNTNNKNIHFNFQC